MSWAIHLRQLKDVLRMFLVCRGETVSIKVLCLYALPDVFNGASAVNDQNQRLIVLEHDVDLDKLIDVLLCSFEEQDVRIVDKVAELSKRGGWADAAFGHVGFADARLESAGHCHGCTMEGAHMNQQ